VWLIDIGYIMFRKFSWCGGNKTGYFPCDWPM